MTDQIMGTEAEDWTIKPALKRACANEKKVFCDNVEAGEARVITCLKMHRTNEGFGEKCAKEVMKIKLNPMMEKMALSSKKLAQAALVKDVVASKSFVQTLKSAEPTSFIHISGWFALASICSFVGVVMYGLYYFCKKQIKGSKGYTVVIPKE